MFFGSAGKELERGLGRIYILMKPRLIAITRSSSQLPGRRSCEAHEEERAAYTHAGRGGKNSLAHEAADRHTPQNAALIPQHAPAPLLRGCFRNTLSCKQRDGSGEQKGCSGTPIFQLFALHRQKKKDDFIIGHRQGGGANPAWCSINGHDGERQGAPAQRGKVLLTEYPKRC